MKDEGFVRNFKKGINMEKMIKIDDIEISENTVKAALNSAGIKLEKEYIPQKGDIVETTWTWTSIGKQTRRVIVSDNRGGLLAIDKYGRVMSSAPCGVDYRKVGELKDLL